jgi:hypothetical protein
MYNTQLIKFNYQYYFLFNKKLNFIFLNYFNLSFIFIVNILTLLNVIFLKKEIIKEKNLNQFSKNILVIESRLKKEKNSEYLKLLNISEFVSSGQKEIYFKNYQRISFFLKNNLILQKKFINEKFYFLKLNKTLNLYFMKAKSFGTTFFIQYRIYGLGFKIKKSNFLNGRCLRFDIGFGHGIYYKLPIHIKCLKRKRRFLLYSNDFHYLIFVKNHIDKLKVLNPYKIRGLKDIKYQIKIKKGKKQSKK